MPSVMQPAEFFVVGGPVQPERPCYVERAADRRLFEALRARRLCCVLGAHGIGKTSALLRAARALRSAGTLVAMIDLGQVAEQAGSDDGDRALCLIAERIAAELGLGVDVATWWKASTAGSEDRLVQFLWNIVLTHTTAPIAIFADDVDAVLDLPIAAEFLNAVGACYERREREPDFTRLSVVLAGCTARRALAEQARGLNLAEAAIIEPGDFGREEAYRLAVAFGGDQELAQALMDRIVAWTGGQPYLTQRVARAVIRKGGRLEDVERVIREQLLSPGAADEDAWLGRVRDWLGDASRPARRATQLLQKIAAGRNVARPGDAAVWERLWLSGTVRVGEQRTLVIGNRIVRELVAARWLKQRDVAWRGLAAAIVLVAVLGAAAYWYTQRLPVADIETLTSATAEPDAVEAAYRRLSGLPGFAQRADELWLDALGRQSREAATLQEAAAADSRLRGLPGQEALADRLLSEFWLRRAHEHAHAEQRDAAILLAQRAAALPEADPGAASYLAELVADDYATLQRSLRLAAAPAYWHMTFAQASLVSLDEQQQALRTPFGAAAGVGALAAAPLKLTALQHAALTRELVVEGEGTAGELELSLTVQHAAAGELLVTLTAPSGAVATVALPRSDGALVETFTFQAAPGSTLAQLADEGLSGAWRLTLVDRAAGNTGVFGGWGLRFGAVAGRDDPDELLAIPDPSRIETVNVQAKVDRAVAWPIAGGAIGSVAVWNLTTGLLEHDFTLPAAPRQVVLDATGGRVLAATDRVAMLWNVADGALVARVATQTEFVLPPVFSADGGYFAIAERVDGANPLYSVLRSADASLVGSIEGAAEASGWELGPGGRYVVVKGPATMLRVVETRRGTDIGRLAHSDSVERVLHSADGVALVTVDRAGVVTAWPLTESGGGRGRPLGTTAAAASVSASADGRRLAFAREDGAVTVLDVGARVELHRLRLPRSLPATRTQLSADGTALITQTGAMFKSWSLPGGTATAQDIGGTDAMPSALAIERASDLVAVGLVSGQLRLASFADTAAASRSLAFFGHRGRITAAALNGGSGLAATGGSDGIVRLWDVATGAPTGAVMQPADVAISAIALSGDGRHVASAAGRTLRVATAADGRVIREVEAAGRVTAIAFAPGGSSVAAGDDTGAVVLAPLDGSRPASLRLDSAVTSLAFTPDGSRFAAGDARGAITLIATATATNEGTVRRWSQPLRWIEFSPDGASLLAATDAWLHSLATETAALAAVHSELAVWPSAGTVWAALSATSVASAGIAADGSLLTATVDLAASSEAAADPAPLVARDWSTAFALRLNDNGEPVPFDP